MYAESIAYSPAVPASDDVAGAEAILTELKYESIASTVKLDVDSADPEIDSCDPRSLVPPVTEFVP